MKKISFIVYYPYQWFIYKNVYNKLDPTKREIIVDLGFQPLLQNKDLEQSIVALLTENNVTFRTLQHIDFVREKYLEDFFSNVEVIVSCWEASSVAIPQTEHIKKVGMTYGIAKELTLLRPTRSIYDVILAYGERDKKLFELMTKSIAIGNPRADAFYLGEKHVTPDIAAINTFIAGGKPSVLYVPTHGDLSSLSTMRETIASLAPRYNIIVKPHYYTLREDAALVGKYRDIPEVLVVDDTVDTFDAIAAVDVVLSDNSSVIFDAMQAGKDIIVSDFLSPHFLDTLHKNLRFSKRGLIGASTYSKSIEQEIKDNDLVAVIKKPEELETLLKDIAAINAKYTTKQAEIVRENFAYTDGHSSDRAVKIINEVYVEPRNYTPGILHHAYQAFGNRLYRTLVNKKEEDERLNASGKDLIVWIIATTKTEEKELQATVYSALGNPTVSQVYVSGFPRKIFGDSEKVHEMTHDEVLKALYETLSLEADLCITTPNTLLKNLSAATVFKQVNAKEALFFAENGSAKPSQVSQTLDVSLLLKNEILNYETVWRDILLDVSYAQVKSLEKCAVLIGVETLRAQPRIDFKNISFEQISAYCIEIYRLQAMPFYVMPNFFQVHTNPDPERMFSKLSNRAIYLEKDGLSVWQWADFKPGKYIWKCVRGDLRYAKLLRLLLIKVFIYTKVHLHTKGYIKRL